MQVVRLIAKALEVTPATNAVQVVSCFINDALRTKPFAHVDPRPAARPAAAPTAAAAAATDAAADVKPCVELLRHAGITGVSVNTAVALRKTAPASAAAGAPDGHLDALVAYSASIFSPREPDMQRTFALLTCMRREAVPVWLLVAFLSAACAGSPAWSQRNTELLRWVVDKVISEGRVASALLERALTRLTRGPLTAARVQIVTSLLIHISRTQRHSTQPQAVTERAAR